MTKNKDFGKKNKILYIVFSIIASLALWLYVAYVDNPEKGVTINGIRVELVGQDLLADNNLIVTNVDTTSLSIEFYGRRNLVSSLSGDGITAVVDLTSIIDSSPSAGTHQLAYRLEFDDGSPLSSDIEVSRASKNYVTVTVEKLVKTTIPVKANYDGGVAEGYTANPPEASPETITVSGPQEVVANLYEAVATLNRENLSKSVSEQVPVILLDKEGNEVPTDDLILSTETVTVTMEVLMVKDVPLEVNLVEGASATDANTKCTIDPMYVTLSGDPEILESYNVITLGTVDLTSFPTTYEETYSIVLPNDVTNLSGETTATVKIEVLNMETTRLSVTNIQKRNEPAGSNVIIITQSLDVTIRGKREDIEAVSADNIWIAADLSGLENTSGTFSVPAKVYINGFDGVDAVGEYKVTVTVS